MMANLVRVTDYNRNAANTHIDTRIHGDGEFAPEYFTESALAHFEVEFTSADDNYEKLHC